MFDNLWKSWPRESQQCINRLKNKQTSYRVLNTILMKVLYERCGSWPQKCYGDGYSTGWLRHFIATRRYEFFNFRSAEARNESLSCDTRSLDLCILFKFIFLYLWYILPHSCAFHTFYFTPIFSGVYYHAKYSSSPWWRCCSEFNYYFYFQQLKTSFKLYFSF